MRFSANCAKLYQPLNQQTTEYTMNEPPILPSDVPADDSTPSRLPVAEESNPYAPAHIEREESIPHQVTRLPGIYWATLAAVFPLTALACYVVPGVGIPAAIALVSAVIRVPLMRARPRAATMRAIPQPLVLLLTSWIFCLIFGFAAVCSFCIICFPLGLMSFGLGGQGAAIPMVFGVSGIIGLLVYLYLFRLSLRMSW